MTEKFAHPVISLLIEHNDLSGHVLLQRRLKSQSGLPTGLLELPQGRLRKGESLAECAARELREETGLVNFQLRRNLKKSTILTETLEIVEGIAVVESGRHSYLGISVVGTAEGIPRASQESSDPRWYSKQQVIDLIASHAVFPLNVPMLLAYYVSE